MESFLVLSHGSNAADDACTERIYLFQAERIDQNKRWHVWYFRRFPALFFLGGVCMNIRLHVNFCPGVLRLWWLFLLLLLGLWRRRSSGEVMSQLNAASLTLYDFIFLFKSLESDGKMFQQTQWDKRLFQDEDSLCVSASASCWFYIIYMISETLEDMRMIVDDVLASLFPSRWNHKVFSRQASLSCVGDKHISCFTLASEGSLWRSG